MAFGSGMDKNQDPGSQINIPDPQLWILYVFLLCAETRIFVLIFAKMFVKIIFAKIADENAEN